jgi:hypothetical protein
VLIANQPIVQHFLKNNKISQTSELLSVKRAKVMSYLEAGLRKLNLNKFIVRNKLDVPEIGPTIAKMLEDDLFAKHLNNLSEANYKPSVENSRAAYNDMLNSNSPDIVAQLVFLSQYYVASEMNQNLLDLTSIVDFNTASYRNINDFYQLNNLTEVAENFNQEAVDKILNNSVLSPFNISNQAISISEQIFDVMASREYQAMLNTFVETNGEFWTTDQRVTEVNNLNNAVVHALIQQYSELDGQDFYSKYGPKSPFLTKGATGNLFSEYITLFSKGSEIADANLKTFTRKNLFLRNFRKKDVEGTKKFYIATLTNEKDVIYTNAMQQAFSDGLNYDKSTPEINARVRKFFDDVANATIVGQGFSIKFRSIHPYLPVEALESAARASFELRRVKDLLFSKEAKTQRKEGNEELKESMTSLLEFIQSVQKIYARNAYSQRKKSLNTWKFFPDYVNLAVDKGIRISSSLKNGLGLALSLASEKHPVNFRGKEFKTAEQAFEFYKGIYTISEDNNAQLGQVKLLRNILGERFKQNLPLFAEVYKKGGSEFLRKSTYNQGADFLKTTTTNIGGYIEAISNAYDDVYDEMFAAMLEAEEQGQTFEEDTTEQFVIEGVEELFNENPELANQVYEALGFNDNNFELKENKEAFGKEPQPEGATSYDIFSNGRKIGQIALFGGKNPMIKGLKLNESERNKGLGKSLYKWLNYKAALQGGRLYADQEFISLDAQRVWESLNKEGLVDLTGNSPKFNDKQKQQAIQQYSAYLDTIFPDSKVKDIVYRGGNLGSKQPQDVEAFTTNKSYAEYRAGQNNTNVYPAVLNIKDSELIEKKETRTLSLDRDDFQYEDYGFTDNKDQTKQLGNFYTVKENNRHILGNKQDIEGFKKFVKDAPKKKVTKSQNKLITSKGDKSPFSEGDGVDFDNLGDVTQKGLNLGSTKSKKKSTGRKPPKSIEDEEVPAAPPNLGEDRPRQIIIPMPGNPITLTPEDLTIERLQLKFPGLNQNQLAVVAKNAREQFEGSSKERDFESKC